MINRDYHTKHFPRLPRHQEGSGATFIAFISMLACISLMGWSCSERYSQVPVSTSVQKEDIKRITAAQLAEETARVNAEMEKRAKK